MKLESLISMKQQLWPKKYLFETRECYLYVVPAEAEEIVV